MNSPENAPKKEVKPVDLIEASFGQLIIREGEDGDCAFIIRSGEVEVFKKSVDGREIHIARLGPKEIFGEMCLFEENARRSASVRVLSDRATIMAISKTNFEQQLTALPDGLRSIIQVLVTRLRKANHSICMLS